jgi:hypothetical protein
MWIFLVTPSGFSVPARFNPWDWKSILWRERVFGFCSDTWTWTSEALMWTESVINGCRLFRGLMSRLSGYETMSATVSSSWRAHEVQTWRRQALSLTSCSSLFPDFRLHHQCLGCDLQDPGWPFVTHPFYPLETSPLPQPLRPNHTGLSTIPWAQQTNSHLRALNLNSSA